MRICLENSQLSEIREMFMRNNIATTPPPVQWGLAYGAPVTLEYMIRAWLPVRESRNSCNPIVLPDGWESYANSITE